MINYKKTTYTVMATILLITILMIIIIHSFNSTQESGEVKITTTTKPVQYGD